MSSPSSCRTHNCEIPDHDEALGIARDEAAIVADEAGGMDLGFVPAQDVGRLGEGCHDGLFSKIRIYHNYLDDLEAFFKERARYIWMTKGDVVSRSAILPGA